MRRLAVLAVFFTGWMHLVAAPAPPKRPMKPEVGPREIDFSPLQGTEKAEYKVHLMIENEKGARFKETYNIQRTGVGLVRDLIKGSLEESCIIRRVGDRKLVVEKYSGAKIQNVEIRVEGIVKNHTPIVKRLAEKPKGK